MMKKRLFSLLLIVAMLFALLPLAALAEEGTEEPEQKPAASESQGDDATKEGAEEGEPVGEKDPDEGEIQNQQTDPADPMDPAPEPVQVIFVCTPEDLTLTLYAKPEEEGEPEPIQPEADGSYMLLPGDYLYTAAAQGYAPAEDVPFTVAGSSDPLQIAVTLTVLPVGVSEDDPVEPAQDPEEPVAESTEAAPSQSDEEPLQTRGLMGAAPQTRNAYSGQCGDNLYWSFDESTGTLTITGSGAMTNYDSSTVPPWYQFRSNIQFVILPDGLTCIGNYALYRCWRLSSVTIPDRVEIIGNGAFCDCSQLSSIAIPNHVTALGDSAFRSCSALVSLIIPDSVTSIGNEAFGDCSALTSITIPSSVASIQDNTFRGCTVLTEITIPNSVTSIGNGAFACCSALTSITIPDSVAFISQGAFGSCISLTQISIGKGIQELTGFEYCASLTSISIPNSVTKIGDSAFYCCTGLTSVTIPDSVTHIGNGAFCGCTGLTSVSIGNHVTSIGSEPGYFVYGAFMGCTGLTSVSIPNCVTTIGMHAFSECTALTSISIPDSVTFLGKDAFSGCRNLASVSIGKSLTDISFNAFSGCQSLTSITIPDNITHIDQAFPECTGLTSIVIPESVTSIAGYAFGGCTGLTSITIPNSVTTIQSRTFYGCTGLTSFTVPDCVKSIEDNAFYKCHGLTSITIPDSLSSIGENAFAYCEGLKDVLYSGTEEQKAAISIQDGNNALLNATWYYNSTGPAVEKVYSGVLREEDGYKLRWKVIYTEKADGTKTDPKLEIWLDGAATTYSGPLYIMDPTGEDMTPWLTQTGFEKTDFVKITLRGGEKNALSTQHHQFMGYSGVKTVAISHIDVLDTGVFQDCTALTLVEGLDSHLHSIAKSAFKNCTNLMTVSGSEYATNLTNIGAEAFNNSALKSITLVETVTNIGEDAFSGCGDLVIRCYKDSYAYQYAKANNISFSLLDQVAPFEIGVDSWSFGNYSGYQYYLTDADYQELISKNISNVEKYSIERIKNSVSGGSCYGMSVAAILIKMGLISASDFQPGANVTHDVNKPTRSAAESRITYYHLQSALVQRRITEEIFNNKDTATKLEIIEDLANQATETGMPFLIEFAKAEEGSHAVVGYGLERGTYEKNGKQYDSRVLVYDCNYPTGSDDSCLYFNTGTKQWTIPNYRNYNELYYASDEPGHMAQRDYGFKDSGNYYIITYYKDLAGNEGYNYRIHFLDTVKEIGTETTDGIKYLYDFNEANQSSGTRHFLLQKDSEYTITPSGCNGTFQLITDDVLFEASGENSEKIVFSVSGGISVTEADSYDLLLVFNDNVKTTPWYKTEIHGGSSESISLSQTEDGLIIDGDNLNDITVFVTDKTKTKQLSLDTDREQVLLTTITENGQKVPIFMVDTDNDGSFETPLAEDIGAPHPTGTVLSFAPGEGPVGPSAEVDGVPYPVVNGTITLPVGVKASVITQYTYNKVSDDPHQVYPVGMKVWIVETVHGVAIARRIPEFDDILQYAGSSIRYTGKKGIRMITAISKDKRTKLIKKQLAGYSLLEYGTVVGWDSELEGEALVLNGKAARQAYAYKKGVADPIFRTKNDMVQYTNVLVGLTNEKCKPDLSMRPYMIVRNAAEDKFVIYGGTVHRSIGYIAYQNRDAFRHGTRAYKFIWDIVHYVYGTQYDAEYWK